jgi:hypothetical protein
LNWSERFAPFTKSRLLRRLGIAAVTQIFYSCFARTNILSPEYFFSDRKRAGNEGAIYSQGTISLRRLNPGVNEIIGALFSETSGPPMTPTPKVRASFLNRA